MTLFKTVIQMPVYQVLHMFRSGEMILQVNCLELVLLCPVEVEDEECIREVAGEEFQ